ncbi:helix-turn-helix domain-containing protein [Cerasicoccus maritimus]|uniref:helix-turn-helix domain-containing protein n=1 Tax=Cerasicoccus maritimus TaxID=490089 RepID=UPI002852820D|nr:helix-turn-helix domain-containing protein [Cerasicoccus maritimus]
MKTEATGWRTQRLVALRLGFDPCKSDDDISEAVGKSKATIYRWFATYREGGLEAVLNRGYKGTKSVNYNEDVQAFLKKGLAASRWNTAVQAQQQLESHFGRRFSYKTVWRWLKKSGWGAAGGPVRQRVGLVTSLGTAPRPREEEPDQSGKV